MPLFHAQSAHGRFFAGKEKLWLAGAAAAVIALVFTVSTMRGSLAPLSLSQPGKETPVVVVKTDGSPKQQGTNTSAADTSASAAPTSITVPATGAAGQADAKSPAVAATESTKASNPATGIPAVGPANASRAGAHHLHRPHRPRAVHNKPLLPGATLNPADKAAGAAAVLTPAATTTGAAAATAPVAGTAAATPATATATSPAGATPAAASGTAPAASQVFTEPVPVNPAPPTEGQERMGPVVIAHRGASGVWPEHSRDAYIEGVHQGSDFIECDVVLTKDLVPICRHDPNLSNSTNANIIFPKKVATREVDGVKSTGVFAIDLTWEEVQKLEAIQPWPFRDQFKRVGPPVSFDEYLHLAQSFVPAAGVYPEIKSPAWHNALPEVLANKTSIEDIVLAVLRKRGYVGPINSPHWIAKMVYIQSYDPASLKKLRQRTCIPLIQLIEGDAKAEMPDGRTAEDYVTEKGLAEIATYAAGIGPGKQLLVDWKGDPDGYQSSGVVERAHAAKLQVHPYTIRSEDQFVLPHLGGFVRSEYDLLLLKLRVDGVFADYPDSVVAYLREQVEAGVEFNMTLTNAQRTCHLPGGSG